jgi:hypothetical protein
MRENLATLGIIVAVVTLAGLGLLGVGLTQREPAAYVVLGGLVTVLVMALGGLGVVFVMWVGYRFEAGREARGQKRFTENAKENLAIMAATQRVQSAQNQMLLRQAQQTTRLLPPPGDTIDVDALLVDDQVFNELEG